MSDFNFESIPRFKTSEANEFPWANCTAGNETVKTKYALLSRLGIPLGTTNNDSICRNRILQSLLLFEESNGNKKHKMVANNHKVTGHVIKIPCAPQHDITSKKKKGRKIEPLSDEEKAKRLYKSGAVDLILDCMGDDGSEMLSNDVEARVEAKSARKEEACHILLAVLAKHYNQAYLSHVQEAQEIAKKLEKKKPFVAPPDLVMHDGGDRNDRDHVLWNVRYEELLKYAQTHGDCLVPSRPTGDQEHLTELSRWVTYQRSSKKAGALSLTPKRIELLESAGFVWAVNPNAYNAVADTRFHKAVAAKLFFQDVTAHDAMVISGIPEDEASNDSRKKLLNGAVCNFYKNKSAKIKEPTLAVVQQLRQADEHGKLNMVLVQVYGESELLSSLLQQGKLVPRADNDGGGKPAAVASAKRPRTDQDDDDENRVRTNHHQKRRLPLATHKKDDRAWV